MTVPPVVAATMISPFPWEEAMPWMRLQMSPTESAGHYEDLQEAFFAVFTAAGAPKDAAMFVDNAAIREGAFYFSPAAAKLFEVTLEAREAKPCATPSRKSVSLLVGHGDPIEMLDA